MKRKGILGVFLVLLLSVVLTACAAEKTATYKGTMSQASVTVKLTHRGDRVTAEHDKLVFDGDKLGANATQMQTVYDTLKDKMDEYDNMKGVSAKTKIDGTKVTETLSIDYDKVSTANFKKVTMGGTSSDANTKKVSLKKTVKYLKKHDFKKVSDE